jgi:two-component system, sensor histidine kinase and response regulator
LNSSAKNLVKLLNSLLEWSHASRRRLDFNPEYFLFSDTAEDLINLLKSGADEKNIRIIPDYSNEVEVYADKQMIFSVIQNLLSNAIKFTERNGIIPFCIF